MKRRESNPEIKITQTHIRSQDLLWDMKAREKSCVTSEVLA
jgi:hypothetical protein